MAQTKKKYVGEDAAGALAHGIDIITPRTWTLPVPDSEADTEVTEDMDSIAYSYPTPDEFKAVIPQVKIGDRLDIGGFLGGSIPVEIPIVVNMSEDNEIQVPWCVAGSKGWVSINESRIGFVFEIGGDNWGTHLNGEAPYPVWGDAGETDNGSGVYSPNWVVSEDLSCFSFNDQINIALKSTEGVYDTEELNKNRLVGRLLSKSTIEGNGRGESYGVVAGVAHIATPGSSTDPQTLPGIFMLSHKEGMGSQTRVTFFPLMNIWKDIYAMGDHVAKLRAKRVADANTRPPRVIVGRLPRIGLKGTRNYYLTPKLPGDGSWIPVSLNTEGFRRWCADATTEKPFTIEAVGMLRVFFSRNPDNAKVRVTPDWLPFNVAIDGNVAIITKKEIGAISPHSYGLFADMSIYVNPSGQSGPDAPCRRLIVRYDEERGWVGQNVPMTGGSFTIDRLAPPTYAEVFGALHDPHNRNPNNHIQIQFRSRAVKPKGSTAESAAKKYNFWSYKKKWGTVFRVRRTHGVRYCRTTNNSDTGDTVKSRSYAHRNFGASEWHYYSVKWRWQTNTEGKKERRVYKLRRLG